MNKRYIDFVPTKKTVGGGVSTRRRTVSVESAVKVGSARKPAAKTTNVKMPVAEKVAPRKVTPRVVREMPQPMAGGGRKRTPKLGVIEDLTDETAGSVTSTTMRTATDNATTIKPVQKNVKKEAYKIPRTPFINQNSVVKRPLSKNVYQKKVVTPVEKPTSPVTIISKPKKEKHTSLIVTIIITIILGAAAGTVAFLLLPK